MSKPCKTTTKTKNSKAIALLFLNYKRWWYIIYCMELKRKKPDRKDYRRIGKIQKRILILLVGGLAFGITRNFGKQIKVFVSLTLSSEIFADNESTSPPTIARQLETEAISPMIKLVAGVTLPPIPRFNNPDFCNKKNNIKNTKPIGIAFQITSSFCFTNSCFSSDKI